MNQARQDKSVPHVTADDMDEPRGDASATPNIQQKDLDAQEKRKHEGSENDLPSSQEKNKVPPGSTQPS